MKHKLIALLLCAGISSIVNAQDKDEPAGKQLILKSDCKACHTEKNKLVGPSYKDIAAKYPSNSKNITLLAGKIIKGGSGVWGQIPMAPHPQMNKKEAEEMVKYILTVK
ncbi:c-type cytochrome [Pseudopedobacter sp.]|uniref:c-type cytochrome n=1 Tax=Pseudopedobacter sp. TaxID=1936787 RepID=UPI00333E5E77